MPDRTNPSHRFFIKTLQKCTLWFCVALCISAPSFYAMAAPAKQEMHFITLSDIKNEPDASLKIAGRMLYDGNTPPAMLRINNAIKKNPESAKAYAYRALGNILSFQYDQAEADLIKASELSPEDPLFSNGLAEVSKLKDRLKKAEESEKIWDPIKHKEVQDNYNKGNVLLESKRYKEALNSYKKALAKNPKMAEAYYGKALCLYYLKDYQNSERELLKAEVFGVAPSTLNVLKTQLETQRSPSNKKP